MPSLNGISQITCYQSGTNLLLPNSADRSGLTNGIAYSYDSATQTFSFNGTNEKIDANWLIFNRTELTFDGVKIGATYYFSHTLPANMYAQITYKDTNNSNHALVYLAGNASKNASVSFTIPNDFASLNQLQIGVARTLGAIDDTAVFMISAFTGADYEAYTAPTTYTADLGRTIYGGEVDVVNGTGQDGYIKYVIDGVNNYGENVSGTNFNIKPYGLNIDGTISKWLCDTLTANSTNFGYNSIQGFIFIRQAGWSSLSGVTDEATFNAYCQEHPITLILPLATPEDFTFTPVPINSRLGDNTMWSDNGNIEVTYRRDIALALAQ